MDELGLSSPAKDALEVYQELLCDWPPISCTEARALSEIFSADKVVSIVFVI